MKGRLARYGRAPDELKILPAATFVLGATEADAVERAADIRRQQVSGPTAILFLEQVWNRDLSAYDPDGPLPDIDPDLDRTGRGAGSGQSVRRPADHGRRVAGPGGGRATCPSASS